jgi:hypothetical protein
MAENGNGNAARREAIRNIIRTHRVGTQEEIRRELSKLDIEATQATISRDLARLKARRVSLPGGGTAYELDEVPVSEGEVAVSAVKELVTAVNESEALVVVNTLPAPPPPSACRWTGRGCRACSAPSPVTTPSSWPPPAGPPPTACRRS